MGPDAHEVMRQPQHSSTPAAVDFPGPRVAVGCLHSIHIPMKILHWVLVPPSKYEPKVWNNMPRKRLDFNWFPGAQ